MFEFKNNHKTTVEINNGKATKNAMDYVERMAKSFVILDEIEQLLKGVKVNKTTESDCLITTKEVKGKGFKIKLLFTSDSARPIAAEIIKEEAE